MQWQTQDVAGQGQKIIIIRVPAVCGGAPVGKALHYVLFFCHCNYFSFISSILGIIMFER